MAVGSHGHEQTRFLLSCNFAAVAGQSFLRKLLQDSQKHRWLQPRPSWKVKDLSWPRKALGAAAAEELRSPACEREQQLSTLIEEGRHTSLR